MERERTFNPSACGSKPPGSAITETWTSYRSGRTGRTLNPPARAHRRFESCLVLQFTPPSWPDLFRPSTTRFLISKDMDGRDKRGHDGRKDSLRVCTPIGRGSALRAHSVAVRVGPDAPAFAPSPLRLASHRHCEGCPSKLAERRRATVRLLRYASGEAARLSIGREGFDLPTERQQGVAQPGPQSARQAPASDAGGRWFESNHPDHFLRRNAPYGEAPIAQLAERTAYTRRELRTGARLEVRVLLGVPALARERDRALSRSSADQSTALRTRGSRVQIAPGHPISQHGRWCVVARNRSSKTGPTSRSRVRLLHLPPI